VRHLPIVISSIILLLLANLGYGKIGIESPYEPEIIQSSQDTFILEDRYDDFINSSSSNPFDLEDPSIIQQEVEYDPATNQYIITERIGEDYYRTPTYMTFEEYMDWRAEQEQRSYFQSLSGVSTGLGGGLNVIDPLERIDVKNTLVDRLFGGTEVDIRPQGNIDLTFGVDFQRLENPILPLRTQRQGGFDFDMNINMSVIGKIGEKLNLSFNYNTGATFNFDNQMKLDYNTAEFSEDEIIKRIEAGNVSLPLRNSLIQGSQNLFGILTELQFGRLRLTTVASQQQSRRKSLQIQGGSQLSNFDVKADEYEENRHFFLSHFNRETFERGLSNLPQINSQFRITRLEVWVTNDRNETENIKDLIAIADLGEPRRFNIDNPIYTADTIPRHLDIFGRTPLPGRNVATDIDANDIYSDLLAIPQARNLDNIINVLQSPPFNFQQSKDFEKVQGRLLNQSEYSFHPELGFVSLNINLRPDQVLGVAFQYDYNGNTYQIGEFASDQYDPDTLGVLYVKMLKSTTPLVGIPLWDLMMKNIYSLNAYQVNQEDFQLDIFYEDAGGGEKRFLPDLPDQPLLQVFNLDNLNTQGDPAPDGIFDFVPGLTIFPQTGRLMFPVLEPFGTSLGNQFDNEQVANFYTYQVLYDSTVIRAREYPELNRFSIRGTYKSAISSEISLGSFNLPRNSVVVRAGGQRLEEGRDYEVDYNIGRLRILNDAILNSGVPISVDFEDNTLFGFQTKTLIGVRADYMVDKNFNIGGTYLQLFERPFTQKVNIGDDPINNRVYGLDLNYSAEAPWLTKAVDFLPFIDTKEKSTISVTAEAAGLKPGHARAINQGSSEDGKRDKSGVVYLDDFEGSTAGLDLRNPQTRWTLASIPQNDAQNNNPLFPESRFIDSTLSNVNRARITWYRTDLGGVSLNNEDPYQKLVKQTEVFPNRQPLPTDNNFIPTLNLTYFPFERGPYNFDEPDGTDYSDGLDVSSGELRLRNPESRWGGIMRDIPNSNFEQANYEFIEFWMLNPFMFDEDGVVPEGGDFYINLGNISEDILRDSRLFYENGLPIDGDDPQPDETSLGLIPRKPRIVNAFANDPAQRDLQDLGFDGLDNQREAEKFQKFVSAVSSMPNVPQAVVNQVNSDPSNDDFKSFRDEFPDNVNFYGRIRRFNNPQNNSPVNTSQQDFTRAFWNQPDTEDINQDNSLNEAENYYVYQIPMERGDPLADGSGYQLEQNQYITDTIKGETGIWYRFKVPVQQYTGKVGNVQDFRAIRFMRMYLTGWDSKVTLRFATLELVRNQWRRYQRQVSLPAEVNEECAADYFPKGQENLFDVNDVNIEENSTRAPFNYVLPRGIERENSVGAFPDALQNEQALALTACNLPPQQAQAIYKILNFDMRVYERLKMFVHAETEVIDYEEGDLSIFMRIGSDFERNYYEYEIPLVMSDPDAVLGVDPGKDEYIDEVWKSVNEFDFPFQVLKDAKIQRNETGQTYMPDPDKPRNTIYVQGNPNLGLVRGIMVGIRNRTCEQFLGCSEVWINELRVSGLDERGGVAALARVDMTLADFGNVTLAGNYSSIGYGGLEQKLAERQREEVVQYDLSASMQLGKLLPKEAGISIPFYAQYSEQIKTPQFDPYDLDIELKDKLQAASTRERRDSLRKQAQDYTRISTINFENIRKQKTGKGPSLPWDISNFSFSYGYTQTFRRNPIIAKDQIDDYRLTMNYGFSNKPLLIYPFKKLIKKDKYFKWISEINLNLIPNSFGLNTQMNRRFQETRYRFTGVDQTSPINTFFNKQFSWNRQYNLNWDIAKALKFTFDANTNAVIDEPREFDQENNRISDQARRDSIWTNIRKLGRIKNYNHNFNINYTAPLKNFPFLDWVNVKAQYNAGYSWAAAALNVDSLGNVIQNNQTRQLNGDLNFETLYNKSKYLKKINGKSRSRGGRGRTTRPSRGSTDKSKDKDKKSKRNREPGSIEKILIRPLMSLRKARLTYTENFSTVVPGFMPITKYMGLNEGFSAPGWDFVGGLQPDISPNSDDWLRRAADRGWMTENAFLNQQVIQNYTQNANARITIEPFNDFEIELEANRNYTENQTLLFKDTTFDQYTDPSEIVHVTPRENGSFTVSYNALNTLFDNDITSLFAQFETNRLEISRRLGDGAHDDPQLAQEGYTKGFGRYQQDVLIPAFLAAYTGRSVNDVELVQTTNDLKSILPRLNWRVNYNGLSKVPGLKNIFTRFSVSHAYKSTLTVNQFLTEVEYSQRNPENQNNNQDFFARYEIPAIVITEQFAPLIGLNVQLKNSMDFRLDFKKSRNLNMSFINNQLSESKKTEYSFGFGYVVKNVSIKFFENLFGGGRSSRQRDRDRDNTNRDPNDPNQQQGPQGKDINIQFDFSFSDDVTINHILDQGVAEPTRGARNIRISPSIDYDINKRLNLRFFFDYNRSVPKTTASFPITNWNSGITVRFRLN
jgi:cell surface protein SprA